MAWHVHGWVGLEWVGQNRGSGRRPLGQNGIREDSARKGDTLKNQTQGIWETLSTLRVHAHVPLACLYMYTALAMCIKHLGQNRA